MTKNYEGYIFNEGNDPRFEQLTFLEGCGFVCESDAKLYIADRLFDERKLAVKFNDIDLYEINGG